MSNRIASYHEFWPHYLREHGKRATRKLHYIGTALTLVALALGVFVSAWWLLAIPLAGYGFAWFAHFRVEHNRPATFTHPWWSLVSDYRMFFLAATGRLGPHLERAGVR
jgi:hypothetical protein